MPETARNAQLGFILILIATFCWSLNAPLVKYLDDVNALMICAMRASFGGVLLLPFLLKGGIPRNRWTVMYVVGTGGVGLTVIAALHLTNSAIAVGMQYTAMIWLMIISAVQRRTLRGEPWKPALLVLAGLMLFMASGMGQGTSMAGNLVALSESVFLAMCSVGGRRAGGSNPLGLTCLASLILGAVLLLVLPGSFEQLAGFHGREWLVFLLIGLFPMAGGYGLFNIALRHVTPQTGSLIASFEMILGPLWVAIFLGEQSPAMVIAGLALIFAGVMWCGLHPLIARLRHSHKA